MYYYYYYKHPISYGRYFWTLILTAVDFYPFLDFYHFLDFCHFFDFYPRNLLSTLSAFNGLCECVSDCVFYAVRKTKTSTY